MSKYTSATDINKFNYCNYQWYYEQKYGRKYIMEIHKKRLEELGYTDTSKSNFKRGLEFHENYRSKRYKKVIALVAIIVIIGVIICLLL